MPRKKKLHSRTHTLTRGVAEALLDPGVRTLLALTGTVILVGAVVYSFLEGWHLTDSIYFTTVTIATIGYGDIAPVTVAGRMFTVFYIVVGIGLFVALASALADHLIHRAREDLGLMEADDTTEKGADPRTPE